MFTSWLWFERKAKFHFWSSHFWFNQIISGPDFGAREDVHTFLIFHPDSQKLLAIPLSWSRNYNQFWMTLVVLSNLSWLSRNWNIYLQLTSFTPLLQFINWTLRYLALIYPVSHTDAIFKVAECEICLKINQMNREFIR